MTFMTVKLLPGVHEVQTPLLLQAGIASSNFLRFRDGLPEKIGGWARLPRSSSLPGPIRELWAWADFNAVIRIGAGGDHGLVCTEPQQDGNPDLQPSEYLDLTPYWNVSASIPAASFATTAGSSVVTITDPGSNVNTSAGIDIQNPIAIGGNLVLSGAYSVDTVLSGGAYTIIAPAAATSTSAGGTCATFTTNPTAASEVITVTLPAHGLSGGQGYFIDLPVAIGGITLAGSYTVLSVVDANTFTIGASHLAQPGQTVVQNGGNVSILYWLVQPPVAPGGGWGVGAWGLGGWGQSVPPAAMPATAKRLIASATPWGAQAMGLDWCLFNWGEQLIAQPEHGPIFFWDPHGGMLQAETISQGPQASTGIFLAMPQQQIVAYGASTGLSGSQDLMLVRWCDNANYTAWIASVSNQAGSYRLTRGSKIVGGMQGPQQAILWTDVGLWLMQYIGFPDVWGFNEIAQGCGLISKKAAGIVAGVVYWMGIDGFWRYAGQGVQRIQCEVWDVVYQNVFRGPANVHIRCAPNTNQNEIAWFFPSITGGGQTENTTFVKLNVLTSEWDYGYTTVAGQYDYGYLTEWIDANVYGEPLSAMRDVSKGAGSTHSLIMQHETQLNHAVGGGSPTPINDANGAPLNWWFETGLFALAEGEQFQFVDRLFPDMKWRRFSDPSSQGAAISVTLKGYRFPEAPPDMFGPFLMTAQSNEVDPRARGRYFSLRVEGNDLASFARLGAFKFRSMPDGRN